MEEAVAADAVEQLISLSRELGAIDGAHVVYFLTVPAALRVDGGKRGEVMLALHGSCRSSHAFLIQGIRMVVNVAGQKGRTDFAAKDSIVIALGPGGFAGMKFRRHLFHGQNADA